MTREKSRPRGKNATVSQKKKDRFEHRGRESPRGRERDRLMRIVGGRLSGRVLQGPKKDGIRPTADRLRESLFNILVHAYGDPVTDARVLDLFAGTGALGLEALVARRGVHAVCR